MRGLPRAVAARWACTAAWLLALARPGSAYQLDPNSTDSIHSIASDMTDDLMSFYSGNLPGNTPGLLPAPYYWWEAGAVMGALVDYWYYTGDTKWNNITTQGLLFQVGPNNDYMPPNQTLTEGNDDQGFWGMAVMSAAEYNFPNPPSDQPQWLALAQAVFNTQAARWEPEDCNGGLRWQIYSWNNGYRYKNSISQGCFFNIGARLARYTGNQSYADWADKTWDWMVSNNLITDSYYIYDGLDLDNCTNITPYQWTYNPGVFLLGAAAMYSYTNGTAAQDKWKQRIDGLIEGALIFFKGNNSDIMSEVACEPVNLCDPDQQSFKAYLSRWMAATTKWAPWTYDTVKPLLAASAVAAAAQCTGGANGRMCGLKWTDDGQWDGSTGVGQQMAAMEVVLANSIHEVVAPVTNQTGGTSVGDPAAGGDDVGRNDPPSILDTYPPIKTADRVGAYILTAITILSLIAGCIYVLLDETSGKSASDHLSDLHVAIAAGGVLRKRRRDGDGEKGKAVKRDSSDRSSADGYPEKPSMVATTRTRSADPAARPGFIVEPSAVPTADGYQGRHRPSKSEPQNADPSTFGFYAPMTAREQRLSHPQAAVGRGRASLRKKLVPNMHLQRSSAEQPGQLKPMYS